MHILFKLLTTSQDEDKNFSSSDSDFDDRDSSMDPSVKKQKIVDDESFDVQTVSKIPNYHI